MSAPRTQKTPRSTDRSPGAIAVAVAIAGTAVLAVVPVAATWDTYAVRFAGLLVAGALWVLAGMLRGLRMPEKRDFVVLAPLLAFAVSVVVATSMGYAPAQMLTFGNGYYAGAVTWVVWLLIVALAMLARPSRLMRSGLMLAQAPIAVVALAAIFQAARGSKALGGFENSNHFVPGVLLATTISLALASTEDVAWKRWASRGCAAAMAVAVVSAGSAAGFLGLATILLLVGFFNPGLFGTPTSRCSQGRASRHGRNRAAACAYCLFSSPSHHRRYPAGSAREPRRVCSERTSRLASSSGARRSRRRRLSRSSEWGPTDSRFRRSDSWTRVPLRKWL